MCPLKSRQLCTMARGFSLAPRFLSSPPVRISSRKTLYYGKTKIVKEPFLHVGRCVHGDIIKEFLNEKNVKPYVRGEDGVEYEIN